MAVVVQISDTHLRSRRGAPDDALARAVAGLRRSLAAPPDLVALTGDLADDGSTDALRRVAALVKPLAAPVLALGGNHDRPGSIAEVFGPPAAVTVGAWRVVPLDTWVPNEIYGAADVDAARAALDADPSRSTLVVQHHPPLGPSTHPWFTLRHGDELLALLAERPHVRALGAGRLHQAFHARRRHLLAVGAPSTWYAIRHEADRWSKAPSGLVGSVVWHLDHDGTATARPVPADRA